MNITQLLKLLAGLTAALFFAAYGLDRLDSYFRPHETALELAGKRYIERLHKEDRLNVSDHQKTNCR